MTYLEHLRANWKVALHSFDDFLEHFIHGLLPFIKWEHEQPKRKLSVVLTIIRIKKHEPIIDLEEAIDEETCNTAVSASGISNNKGLRRLLRERGQRSG